MQLTHITLTTGHATTASRAGVSDDTIDALATWLAIAVADGRPHPLPTTSLAHFSASATATSGALVLTLWAPLGPHSRGIASSATVPLLTLGVAQNARHAGALWDTLVTQFDVPAGLRQPPLPWLATTLHPHITSYQSDIDWMPDFELCVAWTWISRHPSLASVS